MKCNEEQVRRWMKWLENDDEEMAALDEAQRRRAEAEAVEARQHLDVRIMEAWLKVAPWLAGVLVAVAIYLIATKP